MASETGSKPKPTADTTEQTAAAPGTPKRRRGRRLAVLLALAGGIAYALRRRQQRHELDEGVWHEAPSS